MCIRWNDAWDVCHPSITVSLRDNNGKSLVALEMTAIQTLAELAEVTLLRSRFSLQVWTTRLIMIACSGLHCMQLYEYAIVHVCCGTCV
jgi:hypothetical protein